MKLLLFVMGIAGVASRADQSMYQSSMSRSRSGQSSFRSKRRMTPLPLIPMPPLKPGEKPSTMDKLAQIVNSPVVSAIAVPLANKAKEYIENSKEPLLPMHRTGHQQHADPYGGGWMGQQQNAHSGYGSFGMGYGGMGGYGGGMGGYGGGMGGGMGGYGGFR